MNYVYCNDRLCFEYTQLSGASYAACIMDDFGNAVDAVWAHTGPFYPYGYESLSYAGAF